MKVEQNMLRINKTNTIMTQTEFFIVMSLVTLVFGTGAFIIFH